jgi:hypothetical protein
MVPSPGSQTGHRTGHNTTRGALIKAHRGSDAARTQDGVSAAEGQSTNRSEHGSVPGVTGGEDAEDFLAAENDKERAAKRAEQQRGAALRAREARFPWLR